MRGEEGDQEDEGDADDVEECPGIFVQMNGEYGVVEDGDAAGEEHGASFAGAFGKAVVGLYEGEYCPSGDGNAQKLVVAVGEVENSYAQ